MVHWPFWMVTPVFILIGHTQSSNHPGVCQFEDLINKTAYFKPTQDFLNLCKTIIGDLDLNNLKINGNLTLKSADGCLRLVNVDMTKKKLQLDKFGRGKDKCKHNVQSEIRDNPGLCGDDLATFEKFFSTKVNIQQDNATCTILCKTQADVDRHYEFCDKIDGQVDITAWFTNPRLAGKAEQLTNATGELTISGHVVRAISLPRLKKATDLKIVGNKFLDRIELPVLKEIDRLVIDDNKMLRDIVAPKMISIGQLTIKGSLLLTLDKIKGLPVPRNLNGSEVECIVVKHVISSFKELRHCTTIKGFQYLRLKVNQTSDGGLFRAKKLDGCLRVDNSAIWDLDFLNQTKIIGCERNQHIFKQNPHLCPNWLFDDKSPNEKYRNMKADVFGCAKRCWNSTDGECTTFYGDFIITDKFYPKNFAELQIIRGRLIINATSLEKLELPRLRFIYGNNPPLLIIKNNSKLRSLKFPIIRGFFNGTPTTKDKPLVHLENNPWLHELAYFLPIPIVRNCSSKRTGNLCYYDEKKKNYQPPGRNLISLDIVCIVCTTALLATIIVAYCYFKIYEWKLGESDEE